GLVVDGSGVRVKPTDQGLVARRCGEPEVVGLPTLRVLSFAELLGGLLHRLTPLGRSGRWLLSVGLLNQRRDVVGEPDRRASIQVRRQDGQRTQQGVPVVDLDRTRDRLWWRAGPVDAGQVALCAA